MATTAPDEAPRRHAGSLRVNARSSVGSRRGSRWPTPRRCRHTCSSHRGRASARPARWRCAQENDGCCRKRCGPGCATRATEQSWPRNWICTRQAERYGQAGSMSCLDGTGKRPGLLCPSHVGPGLERGGRARTCLPGHEPSPPSRCPERWSSGASGAQPGGRFARAAIVSAPLRLCSGAPMPGLRGSAQVWLRRPDHRVAH